MTAVMTFALALCALNGLLALGLAGVYARNHRQVRSPFTLGLVLFAVALAAHAAAVVYSDLSMMATYTPRAESLRLATTALQTVALGALSWATLR
jgi:hypothetical protein